MGYTETTSNGVTTRTYSDGRVEKYSVYGRDVGGTKISAGEKVGTTSRGDIVVVKKSDTKKRALTDEEVAQERQRQQEETGKYGYYTPLEQGEDGKYYQTAPELSPSRYIQTPDSEEGRRIIARHPAGELAYEGSANWVTPAQAEAKLKEKLTSGEYTSRQIGYRKEIGVKGEGGVAYYGDDVVLGSLIRKKEPKGVGLDYGPDIILGELHLEGERYKEVRTKSIVGEIVGSGAGVLVETKGGFEIRWTETGQQQKEFWLEQLRPEIPSYWLMRGTSEKLIFSGMPYTTTTTEEKGKTTSVITDFYGREIGRSVEIRPLASAGKPEGEQLIYDYDVAMFRNYPGFVTPLPPYVVPSSPPTPPKQDEKLVISVPGLKEAEERKQKGIVHGSEYLTFLTQSDMAIEASPLGGMAKLGKQFRQNAETVAGWGLELYRGMKGRTKEGYAVLEFVENMKNNPALPGVTVKETMLGAGRWTGNFEEAVMAFPENTAKIGVRAISLSPIVIVPKFFEGKGMEYVTSAGSYVGGVAVAGAAAVGGFAAQAAADPIGTGFVVATTTPKAAEYAFFEISPQIVAGYAWGGFVNSVSEQFLASRTPTKMASIQAESGNVYRTDTVVSYQSGRTRLFTKEERMFSFGVSYYDDATNEVRFTNMGFVKGKPGGLVSVNVAKVGDEMVMPAQQGGKILNVGSFGPVKFAYSTADDATLFAGKTVREYSVQGTGIFLKEGEVYAWVGNMPGEIVGPSAGFPESILRAVNPKLVEPVYMPPARFGIFGEGTGTTFGAYSRGYSMPLVGEEEALAKAMYESSQTIPNGFQIKPGSKVIYSAGATTIVSNVKGAPPLTLPTETLIFSIEKAPVAPYTEMKGFFGGLEWVGPSVGGGGYAIGGSGEVAVQAVKEVVAPRGVSAVGGILASEYSKGLAVANIGKAVAGGMVGVGGAVGVSKAVTVPRTVTAPPKTEQITETTTIPKIISSPGTYTAERKIQIEKVPQAITQIPKVAQITAGGISTRSLVSQIEKVPQIQRTAEMQRVMQVQKIAQIQLPVQETAVATMAAKTPPLSIVTLPPPPPPPPRLISPLFAPGLGFSGRRERSVFTRQKIPTQYKPSLLGVITNTRITKAPKFVSGAEWARGIVVAKKKKRNKR